MPLHVLTRVTVGASAPGPGVGAKQCSRKKPEAAGGNLLLVQRFGFQEWNNTVRSREYVPPGQPIITALALQGLELLPDKKKKSCPAWMQ